ncbi:hypothetical protein V2J09_008199 [Rumex salicifolius]
MATIGHNNLNAKLVLLGDMGAGKSSLVLRFVKGQFLEFQESTIGAAFFSQTLAVNDTTVKFEIWDTAGQERYHSLAPMYYRGAAAAIIVFDITSTESFGRAKKWVQELQKQGNPNMVMALAGNKADLEEKRIVSAEEARSYAEENGLFFMETSAKTALNVNDLFHEIGLNVFQGLNFLRIRQAWFLLIDLQTEMQPLDHAVLKDQTELFAPRPTLQLRHKHHLLRHHIPRQIPPTILHYPRLCHRRLLRCHNKRARALPPLRVGHGDHSRLRHRGVAEKNRLDFHAAYVLSAGDDDVFGSVFDLHVAVGVDYPDVPRPEPAVPEGGTGGGGVVEVAFHDPAAAEDDLPGRLAVSLDALHGGGVLHVYLRHRHYADSLPRLQLPLLLLWQLVPLFL